VLVANDTEAESPKYHLRSAGYAAIASVEHETQHRLSTVRLMSPSGQRLLQFTSELDVGRVREHLARITTRGYAREQDREAKLKLVLRDVGHPSQ
jgi:hypothetical protein